MLVIGRRGSASHRALCSSLNIPRTEATENGQIFQRTVVRTFRNGLRRFANVNIIPTPRELYILWGVSPNLVQCPTVLNKNIVFDKLQQLRFFRTGGVQGPNWMERNEAINFQDNLSWLGRRRHHMAGHDITGPWTTEQMRDRLRRGLSDYGVQLIDKTHEWRIHVFNGDVIRRARKVWPDNAGPLPDSPIWNAERGWHFRYNLDLRERTREDLDDLAKRAVRALGMDFGAVDIIGRRADDRRIDYYVLEVNSAPGLADNPNTLAAYVSAIRRWANDS